MDCLTLERNNDINLVKHFHLGKPAKFEFLN